MHVLFDVSLICLFSQAPTLQHPLTRQPQRYVREHACPHRESASKRGSESVCGCMCESAGVRERESVLVFFVRSSSLLRTQSLSRARSPSP